MTPFVQRDFPIGSISAWSGAIVNVPSTFRLCDGTNGTPDLRNRFIAGAGTSYNPADTGGALLHDHDFTGDGHQHGFLPGDDFEAGATKANTTDPQSITGTTNNGNTLAPYYSLAYIMYAGRPL